MNKEKRKIDETYNKNSFDLKKDETTKKKIWKLLIKSSSGSILHFKAIELKETENHIWFIDKFGKEFKFHNSLLLELYVVSQ